MATRMTLEIISGADSITVLVIGDVDLASKDLLEEAMCQLGVEPRNLVIDLRSVTFIDSMGLGMLLRVHNTCHDNGGSLVVASPSDNVRRLLKLTEIDQVLTIIG